MDTDEQVKELITQQFSQLPKVVQDAITSADVTKHMRELANTHKLHVDQWESLESVVQFTLLALKPIGDLEANIKKEVGVPDEEAHAIAQDIGRIVFEPIRQELERELAHPEAKEKSESAIEATRSGILTDSTEEASPTSAAPVSAPTTSAPVPAITAAPLDPKPSVKAAPIASAPYLSNTPSHERPGIEGDPYREQVA